MSVLGGLVAGIFGTALLDAAVSSPRSGGTTIAAKDLGGAFGLVGKALARIVDPTIPAVPDRSKSSASSPAASAPGAGPVSPKRQQFNKDVTKAGTVTGPYAFGVPGSPSA